MPTEPRLRRAWSAVSGPQGRLVLIVALAAVELVLVPFDDNRLAPAVVQIPLGLLGVAALFWRRRFPMVVTGVTGLVAAIAGLPGAAFFALASLGVRRRDRGLIVATGYVAVCIGAPWLIPADDPFPLLVSGAFGAMVAALFGAYVGARRDLVSSLRERADRAEAERELRGEQARIAERARIAREMHDVLAHKVSLIALQAGALEVNPAQSPEAVEASAALIRSTARATLEDLRGVLGVLRDDQDGGAPLTPQPDLADLDRLVGDSRAAGVQVDLRMDTDNVAVDPIVGRTVYRVVQESLTNVHKHARGARSAVEIVTAADAGRPVLVVTVTNARPVAAGSLLPGSGVGLTGLRERIALVGGTLDAAPFNGGWRVRAQLPLS